MVKKIYVKIHIIFVKIKWIIDAIFYRANLKYELKNEIKEYNSILIIAPHADDEWIGCSELISKHPENVKILYLNMLGTNVDKSNRICREKEIEKLCHEFNIELISVYEEYSKNIKLILEKISPKLICVPYYIDWHSEHRYSCEILKNILIESNKSIDICSYQVSVPIPKNEITHVTKIKIFKKWGIFNRIYKSQNNMPLLRFMCNEFINGKYIKSLFGNSYCIKDRLEWCEFIKNNEKVNIEYMNKKINNIKLSHLFMDKKLWVNRNERD